MCMKDRLILQREADLEMTCVKCNKNRSSDFAHAVSSVASTNSDPYCISRKWLIFGCDMLKLHVYEGVAHFLCRKMNPVLSAREG